MIDFQIDKDKCIQCGECAADCPAGIIAMNDFPEITDEGRCYRCQHCYSVCPTGAVSILGLTADDAEPKKNPPSPEQMASLVTWRRSIRRYKDENLSPALIDELINTTSHAPTGVNAQGVVFTVVRDKAFIDRLRRETLDRLGALVDAGKLPEGIISQYLGFAVNAWRTNGRDAIFRGAPHMLLTSTPPGVPCPVQDAHIALATFELLASAHGLGTLWDGMFMMALAVCPELKETLRIPTDHTIGYAMLFGRPEVQYHRPVKRGPAKVNILE
ncbi:nitroreductase/NAD-dependent dihydropyrimidine dehydrogenase PreA subunit [Desulfomicrobium macestii]|uniref:Nitroreductase/NAD-dependent dihydropyrimidine dehydrogenase PreA subunit n=1 Tax=Desulfomicrobium macestii TaxID=90731 RepID=A0ABR9H4C2_9BACT|nr:nitroreductase family protein [Desulfomicrobium macestii]MBE1425540.1 nitroreductase/NAD-dependent dihydropyrimidine dehydrogenase PreA subunit [Desulfomicrobium macestii]